MVAQLAIAVPKLNMKGCRMLDSAADTAGTQLKPAKPMCVPDTTPFVQQLGT